MSSVDAAIPFSHAKQESFSTGSKLGITICSITAVVGCLFMILGLTGILGNFEETKFIGTVVLGGLITLISIVGLTSLISRKSQNDQQSSSKEAVDAALKGPHSSILVDARPPPAGTSSSSSSQTVDARPSIASASTSSSSKGIDIRSSVRETLRSWFLEQAERIRKTPQYAPEIMDYYTPGAMPTRDYTSVFIHAHQVLPGVYLGDYRGFLSVDSEFVRRYAMVDPIDKIFENPTREQRRWAATQLDRVGCSDKNIKVVVSVTQFKSSVGDGDWSKFQPNLTNIERMQIPVDDLDGAWNVIRPRLDEIFSHIDLAIQGKGNRNILVHCVKGASRSAAVIYAYLMNRCGVTLDQAFNYVQTTRHHVELKPSMRKDLELYEKELSR